MKIFFSCFISFCALTISIFGQSSQTVTSIKLQQTPAYKFLLSEKTKAISELQELQKRFTETFPTVEVKKLEIKTLDVEIVKLYSFQSNQYNLLSKCYGELIIQKVEADVSLQQSLNRFTVTHPLVQEKAQALVKLEYEIANYFK